MTETPNEIPQANAILYTVKLVSGDELLCTLIDFQDTGIMIESPVVYKIIPILMEDGSFMNRMHHSAWMPFSDTRIFYIDHADIVTLNPMHESNHIYYTRLVNQLEMRVPVDSEATEPSESSFFVPTPESIQ